MNSREIVIRAIEFDGPERVPLYSFLEDTDVVDLPLLISDPVTGWDYATCRAGEDEWGCYWTTMERTMGQVTGHPLSDWRKLETYEFPDPYAERRFSLAKEKKRRVSGEERYLMGWVPFTLFERMHFLRGFRNLLVDLHVNKDKVLLLADKVLSVQIEIVKQWAELGVDGVGFTDDWGGQEGLFIPPKLFREIFKPRYRRLFDAVHRRGMHAFLHSDGQIREIIPDFIEIGLDVINVQQPRLLGIDDLGRDFGGRICFCSLVDNQTTLIYGAREEIRREARHLVEALGRFNGGLIAGWLDECDVRALGIPMDNIRIMCDAFREFGKYR